MIRTFLALFIAFALFSQPAHAALDEKGAQELKIMFTDWLKKHEDGMAARGGKLIKDGEVTVEISDNYYAVTLPHLTAQGPDGSRVDIGMVAINAMPGDTPETWKMTAAIPTPVIFYDAQGNAETTVSIGQQNFAGIWNKKFKGFIKLQAQYKNMTVKMADNSFTATLPDSRAVYDLKDDGTGLWSGPMKLTASDLAVNLADSGTATFARINSVVNLIAYNPESAAAYGERMAALTESYNAGEESGSASHISGVYNMIADLMGSVWDGFTMNLDVDGVHMTRPPIPGSPAGDLSLSQCGLSFGMTGFRTGSVMMQFGFNYKDFAMTPPSPDFDETMPTSAKLDLRLNNLPFKALADLGRTSIEDVAKMPDAGTMIGMKALMSLPMILTQAQTNMSVEKETYFSNKDYSIRVSGTVKPDLAAQKSAVGTATIEITGLEKLLANINQRLKDPNTDPAKMADLQETQSMLTVLQMAGQQQGDGMRVYNIELNQQGQVLINGTDMTVLMGGSDTQPQAEPAHIPLPTSPRKGE